MVQAGDMRRSEEALADEMSSGISCAVVMFIMRSNLSAYSPRCKGFDVLEMSQKSRSKGIGRLIVTGEMVFNF